MIACLFLNLALCYFGSSFSYAVGIVECTHVDLLSLLNNVLQIYLIFFTHPLPMDTEAGIQNVLQKPMYWSLALHNTGR